MRDPFKIDGPTCISFSGGRTSAYMLWRVLQSNGGLPADARVVFANTGKEEEATLRFVRDCSERWGVSIAWVEYAAGDPGWRAVDYGSASRNGEPFEAVIASRMTGESGLPNRVARYCSSELKTRTMHRYLRAFGVEQWTTFVGLRADEPSRVSKLRANPHPETKDEEVFTPLASAGVGALDVARFWSASEFDLGLPNMNGKTMHGNCDLCFLKPSAQVVSLISEKPARAIWWAKQEARAEAVGKGTAARFRDDRPSYAQMLAYTQAQTDAFGHVASQIDDGIECVGCTD